MHATIQIGASWKCSVRCCTPLCWRSYCERGHARWWRRRGVHLRYGFERFRVVLLHIGFDSGVRDHDEAPGLTVAAIRRGDRRLEDRADQLGWHRIGPQPPHRASGVHDLEDVELLIVHGCRPYERQVARPGGEHGTRRGVDHRAGNAAEREAAHGGASVCAQRDERRVDVIDESENSRRSMPVMQQSHAIVPEVVTEELHGALDRGVRRGPGRSRPAGRDTCTITTFKRSARAHSRAAGRIASDATDPSWHTTIGPSRRHSESEFGPTSAVGTPSSCTARWATLPSTAVPSAPRPRVAMHSAGSSTRATQRVECGELVVLRQQLGADPFVAGGGRGLRQPHRKLRGIVLFQRHRRGHEQKLGVECARDGSGDGERAEREVRTVERDDHGLRHAGNPVRNRRGAVPLRTLATSSTVARPGPPEVGGSVSTFDARHRGHGGRHRPPERVEVVPAFEERDAPAGRGRELGDPARQGGVVAGAPGQVGQRIVAVSVEARGDEHPSRARIARPPVPPPRRPRRAPRHRWRREETGS